MMRPFPAMAILAGLSMTIGCDRPPEAPEVEVANAWVRLPATAEAPAAGYFSASAATAGEELVAITADQGRAELHESMSGGGMAMMRPLQSAPFEPDRTLDFRPGGKHLMLYDLPAGLKEGGRIILHFRFRSAPPLTVEAQLVKPGGGPPEHVH